MHRIKIRFGEFLWPSEQYTYFLRSQFFLVHPVDRYLDTFTFFSVRRSSPIIRSLDQPVHCSCNLHHYPCLLSCDDDWKFASNILRHMLRLLRVFAIIRLESQAAAAAATQPAAVSWTVHLSGWLAGSWGLELHSFDKIHWESHWERQFVDKVEVRVL